MKQKLITAAVAGAFALPGVALAQVSITGSMDIGYDNQKIDNISATRATLNKRQSAVISAAAIQFNIVEDLGGGTDFYALYEFRPQLDGANVGNDALPVGSTTAPAYMGLRNKAWGAVRFGSITTMSGKAAGKLPTGFRMSSQRLIDYTTIGASPLSFGSGRLLNAIVYTLPAMGGFKMDVSYSTNGKANDQDMLSAGRKGSAYEIMPSFDFGFMTLGYGHTNMKYDNSVNNVKSNKVYLETELAGIVFGLNYRQTTVKSAAGAGDLSKTKAWSLPISYQVGPHHIGAFVAKVGDDTVSAGDQKAKQVGIGYNYSLSKRTSLSIEYTKLTNANPDAAGVGGSAYEMSANGGTADGADGFTALAGEDVSSIVFGLHHKF